MHALTRPPFSPPRRIDESIALLDALEALYQNPAVGTPGKLPPFPFPLTDLTSSAALAARTDEPRATAKGRPPLNKKRKTDSIASRAGSPTSSAAPSPIPLYPAAMSPPPIPANVLPHAQSAKPSPASLPQPLPIAPAPMNKKPTAKSRKDALLAQLPLRPGRTIAVKESKKAATAGPASDTYILGRIVQCLQGDKNRWVALRTYASLVEAVLTQRSGRIQVLCRGRRLRPGESDTRGRVSCDHTAAAKFCSARELTLILRPLTASGTRRSSRSFRYQRKATSEHTRTTSSRQAVWSSLATPRRPRSTGRRSSRDLT